MNSTKRWLLVCVLYGTMISALPHFMMWAESGSPFWISDFDELELYWPLACNAYWNHPLKFSDPLFAEVKPATYPAIQIAAGTWLAKAFDLGPGWIGFFWRLLAGASVGGLWYLIFRSFARSALFAACVTIVFLSDSCLVHGKLFSSHLSHA
ncbi:MAG: hypothetical protein ABL958_20910, partial [Bdellovibrionia bacterium]